MNGTYHLFTTETDRDRTSSISYRCDKVGEKDRKELRGSGHTAGFYTINASGKVLPPLYLFDSSTPNSGNYHIQSSWYKKLSNLCYLSYHFNYLLIIKQQYPNNDNQPKDERTRTQTQKNRKPPILPKTRPPNFEKTPTFPPKRPQKL